MTQIYRAQTQPKYLALLLELSPLAQGRLRSPQTKTEIGRYVPPVQIQTQEWKVQIQVLTPRSDLELRSFQLAVGRFSLAAGRF